MSVSMLSCNFPRISDANLVKAFKGNTTAATSPFDQRPTPTNAPLLAASSRPSETLPLKHLSPTDMQKRRTAGLCYNCPEKAWDAQAAGSYVMYMNYKGLASGGAPMAGLRYTGHMMFTESLSLGPDAPQGNYFSSAISIGSFDAVSHVITVVSSVGTEGAKWSATNLAPWIITESNFTGLRISSSEAVLGSQHAPRVASFSSKGPPHKYLKPDVAATGLEILAAWSPAIGQKMKYSRTAYCQELPWLAHIFLTDGMEISLTMALAL
ncbi:subtilisin-like protease SBT3.9 [Artemisia annua]|uniref:Subtilisin-like protease SBT3.9 n=1 Tax=Artemisia annua TaxID=35608 RepID=A0A2U1NJI0_ARTAN|nr:subtilisin-like protease SBT3.9 [Artemisia annua]